MSGKQMLKITMAMIAVAYGSAHAEILYSWNYTGETNGTLMSEVTSTGTQTPISFPAYDVATDLAVTDGNLIVNRSDGSTGANTFANITDLSSGTYWIVAEFDGWANVGAGGTLDIRFNGDDTTGGTLAGMRTVVLSTGVRVSLVNSSGQSTVRTFGLDETDIPIILALELNFDTQKTTIHYKYGLAEWTTGVEKDAVSAADATHIRFTAQDFASDNQMNMSELYLTNEDPTVIPEPTTLGLFGITAGGLLFLRRVFTS